MSVHATMTPQNLGNTIKLSAHSFCVIIRFFIIIIIIMIALEVGKFVSKYNLT